MKKLFLLIPLLFSVGCSSAEYRKTVAHVNLEKFMKKWYVIAGRFTFMENGAHNAIEEYTFNENEKRIDVNFYFNKDSFDGKIKKIPQKAWIENSVTNAHWKVSPFWPLKFDYLIIALADDYSWTAIGVPSQKYLWIMSDQWNFSDSQLQEAVAKLESLGYSTEDIVRIPHRY